MENVECCKTAPAGRGLRTQKPNSLRPQVYLAQRCPSCGQPFPNILTPGPTLIYFLDLYAAFLTFKALYKNLDTLGELYHIGSFQ